MDTVHVAAQVCDCCMLWLVNADESSCREFYGHAHPRVNLADFVQPDHWYDIDTGDPEDEARDASDWEVWHRWTCDGCGEPQYPGARRWDVLTD